MLVLRLASKGSWVTKNKQVLALNVQLWNCGETLRGLALEGFWASLQTPQKEPQ